MNRMNKRNWMVAGIAVAVVAAGVPGTAIKAQQTTPRGELPLAQVAPRGNFVAPYFDGFIRHEDGSRTFSFGYLNRNASGVMVIPVGPDNSIEPARFNGMQPTHFYTVNYGGFGGPRERGSFAVHVPADYQGDVVWTIRSPGGQVAQVPGRSTSMAYELSMTPQAAGSMRPYVRFSPDGEPGWGPTGVFLEETLTTSAGQPLPITVWGQDRGERDPTALNMTWQIHQGPAGAAVEFEPRTLRLDTEGEAANQGTTQVTFDTPGEYILRVRIDNFTVGDSSFGNQCCWSNGYVNVTVN